jgi:hypothetical protein
MNWFKRLFSGEFNKALVPLGMVGIYFINREYGVDLPLAIADDLVLIIGMLTSFATYHVPNK